MFAYATEPLRSGATALSRCGRKPVSLPWGNLIGLHVDHAKAAQFPCIFGFWCISTNGAGLWCCSLDYPVLHQGLHWGFERTPIKWKTRMPGRTRCAESDAFYACGLLFKLAYCENRTCVEGKRTKSDTLCLQDMEGKTPHGREGIFPPSERPRSLSLVVGLIAYALSFEICWEYLHITSVW